MLSLKCYVCSSSTTNEECNKNTQECIAPVDRCMTVVDTLGNYSNAGSLHRRFKWFKLRMKHVPPVLEALHPNFFVLRLCKVHSEAMRQPVDLQKRLLVCGLKRRRKHHKLLQHSRSVQLQRSQVHSHTHTPAAVDCWGVIYAVALKVAPLTLCWDFGLI